MKLRFARIVTRDLPALTKFYREITGLTPKVFSDAYVEFSTSGAGLAISGEQTMEQYGPAAAHGESNHSVIFDFQVEDVDREHARLVDRIGHFVMEPRSQPWGNRSMLFRDPDGNLINFFAPIDRVSQRRDK